MGFGWFAHMAHQRRDNGNTLEVDPPRTPIQNIFVLPMFLKHANFGMLLLASLPQVVAVCRFAWLLLVLLLVLLLMDKRPLSIDQLFSYQK